MLPPLANKNFARSINSVSGSSPALLRHPFLLGHVATAKCFGVAVVSAHPARLRRLRLDEFVHIGPLLLGRGLRVLELAAAPLADGLGLGVLPVYGHHADLPARGERGEEGLRMGELSEPGNRNFLTGFSFRTLNRSLF